MIEGYEDLDDDELLARHVGGDSEAFAALIERHRDRLWAVALRTTRNGEEAADGLQDAIIAAYRRAASFRGGSAVTTWLHRIVVNACLDRLRRAKVRAADALPDQPDRHPRLATGDQAVEAAEANETADEVAKALDEINPDQRAAIVLVDMEGYSVDEAATMLGCAPGTVKSRCFRGRARLRDLLAHLQGVVA